MCAWQAPGALHPCHKEHLATGILPQAVVAVVLGRADHSANRKLQPALATAVPQRPGTDLLAEVDSATQSVIQAIAQAQAAQPPAQGAVHVHLAGSEHALLRRLTVAEMRGHKRTFLRLATQNQFGRFSSAEGAAVSFLEYLQSAA